MSLRFSLCFATVHKQVSATVRSGHGRRKRNVKTGMRFRSACNIACTAVENVSPVTGTGN